MSRTDLIADTFAIMKNSIRTKKEDVFLPYSKSILKICEILQKEGYIENYKETDLENIKKIKVYFKYDKKRNAITDLKKISRPGRRIYVSKEKVPNVLNGFGVAFVSTSSGVLSDKEARAKGIGGEVLGMAW